MHLILSEVGGRPSAEVLSIIHNTEFMSNTFSIYKYVVVYLIHYIAKEVKSTELYRI